MYKKECHCMEIIFIILCIAIGIGIPRSISYIRKLKTACFVSAIFLVFAVTLLVAGIVLFAVTEKTSCGTHEICAACAGYSIVSSGEQCLACHGAGKTFVTVTTYSISLLYPVCMTVLGLYALILRYALQEVIISLESIEPRSVDDAFKKKNK